MKINYKKLIGSTFLFSALFFVGCGDDDASDIVENVPIEEALESGAMDLTDGYNVVVWDINDLAKQRLKFRTKYPVQIANLEKLKLALGKVDGKYHLTPGDIDLSKLDLPVVAKLELKVPACEALNKKVMIVLRDSKAATKSATDDNTNEIKDRALSVIGSGIDVCSDVGTTVQGSFFNKNLIDDCVTANSAGALTSLTFEYEGSTQSSVQEEYAQQVGLSGEGTYKSWTLSGSASVANTSSSKNQNYMEYYLGFSGSRMATATMDYVKMKGKDSTDGDVAWHKGYIAYADNTIIDVLNNPNSSTYKQYDNENPEDIYKLLNYYGTCAPTQLSLGAYALGAYMRSENIYENKISTDVDVEASLASPSGMGSGVIGAILGYIRNRKGSGSGSFDYGYGCSNEEYLESTRSFKVGITKGGGSSATSEYGWEATSDPKNWVAISYNTGASTDLDPSDAFISILELCTQDQDRRDAIEKALTDDGSGIPPYFAYRYKPVVEDLMDTRLVVADVMMKVMDNNHPAGTPSPFVAEGPDGKSRVYYPMMENVLGAGGNTHFAVETSRSEFITATDNGDHCWFYALDHADECNGITDIRFMKEDDARKKGYVIRGNHANEKITGSIDDNYVAIQLGSNDTSAEDKITGVGLVYAEDKKSTDNYTYQVFASTGGTEYGRENTSDDADYFHYYWGPCTSKSGAYSDVKYHIDKDDCFYKGGLSTPRSFGVCYTKQSIKKRFVATSRSQKGCDVVLHPNKWE